MKTLFSIAVLMVLGCAGCGNPEEDGHVWQDQTKMIDKAKGVEDTLMQENLRQRQQIEEMAQ